VYVRNLIRCNKVFGDDVRLEGITLTAEGVSIVISQPFIVGRKPTEPEVTEWFCCQGCVEISKYKWRYPDGMVVSDAHTGNLIMMRDGTLIPIDLHIEKTGENFPSP
jgi:hypothetical protein